MITHRERVCDDLKIPRPDHPDRRPCPVFAGARGPGPGCYLAAERRCDPPRRGSRRRVGGIVPSNFRLISAGSCDGDPRCGQTHPKVDPQGDSCTIPGKTHDSMNSDFGGPPIGHEKTHRIAAAGFKVQAQKGLSVILALTGLEATVGLVDHIDPALAAHHLAIAVAAFERAERVANLHRSCPHRGAQPSALKLKCPRAACGCPEARKWWAVLGSNQWPLRCQRSALPLS